MAFWRGVHAEAMLLAAVLEQGVATVRGPGRSVVCAVRVDVAPGPPRDGGAAGGVGDIHAVAEQLGDRGVRRDVSAQPAQEPENSTMRLQELAALDVGSLEALLLGYLYAVIENVLLDQLRFLRNHLDGLYFLGQAPTQRRGP